MSAPLKRISNAFLSIPRVVLLSLIWVYQNGISPWFGPCCRFRPTCSAYGKEAIQKYGAMKGTILTIKRIIRCRPGVPGGYDPVP